MLLKAKVLSQVPGSDEWAAQLDTLDPRFVCERLDVVCGRAGAPSPGELEELEESEANLRKAWDHILQKEERGV